MTSYKQIDLTNIKTISIASRKSKVKPRDFAHVYDPTKEVFANFIKSLPHILVAKDLRKFVDDVVQSRRKKKPVIVMIGAHVIKVGLSPILIDLLQKKIVTCVAMNSAAAIHDVETAMWGRTSEDVEANLSNGRFGMSKETGEFINTTLVRGMKDKHIGYAEALGKALQGAPNKSLSILATCYKLDVPVTVHAAIGTDITHQQPTMNGAATGELSFRDFKVLCNVVKDLRGSGVVMNIGSAVLLPEVFLKALTVARNLGYKVRGFTTANFDMIQHYRPRMNVVHRPTRNGGTGYMFTGHHEIMIPLVAAMIKDSLRKR
jgi:deoxyhypusine synthase